MLKIRELCRRVFVLPNGSGSSVMTPQRIAELFALVIGGPLMVYYLGQHVDEFGPDHGVTLSVFWWGGLFLFWCATLASVTVARLYDRNPFAGHFGGSLDRKRWMTGYYGLAAYAYTVAGFGLVYTATSRLHRDAFSDASISGAVSTFQ